MLFILLTVVAIVAGLIYQWTQNQRKYFENIGIEYDKNATPLLGTFKNALLRRENFFDALETVYKKFDSGYVKWNTNKEKNLKINLSTES